MNFRPVAKVTGEHVLSHTYCIATYTLCIKSSDYNNLMPENYFDMSEQLHMCQEFCPRIFRVPYHKLQDKSICFIFCIFII